MPILDDTKANKITTLDLSNGKLEKEFPDLEEFMNFLAEFEKNTSITAINFSNNSERLSKLNYIYLDYLCEAITKRKKFISLDLSKNKLDANNNSCKRMLQVDLNCLHQLFLSECDLDDAAADLLVKNIYLQKNLSQLDVTANNFTPKGQETLRIGFKQKPTTIVFEPPEADASITDLKASLAGINLDQLGFFKPAEEQKPSPSKGRSNSQPTNRKK